MGGTALVLGDVDGTALGVAEKAGGQERQVASEVSAAGQGSLLDKHPAYGVQDWRPVARVQDKRQW